MLLIDLNGKWQMKRIDETSWIDATVPGSVYSDLMNAGKIEDPFYRENEIEAFKISEHDFEYKRTFQVDKSVLEHDRIFLLCEGLDTLCELFVNGNKVLDASNMHRTYEVDVKGVLKEGTNEIHVLFRSPVVYINEKQREKPLLNPEHCVNGIGYLRKAHSMFGWDWGPKLPDMGIWRNISIRGYDSGRIQDVYVTQNHNSSGVDIDVRVNVESWGKNGMNICVQIESPETGGVLEKIVPVTGTEHHIPFHIDNPQLWWPNNLGKQPLYKVKVFLLECGKTLDETSFRIGLRTLTVRRQPDEWGESFEYVINGIPIFAMGADYIPEDNILSRCSPERTKRLLKSCVQANFNTIRVWGGGYYPDDYFYDFCDEYGLIVWQDLMYACSTYVFTDEFKENITQETIDNMKRIRHHASLGLWCGNNEMETAWAEGNWDKISDGKPDYIRHFEVCLPEIAKKTDPQTFYWPSSPSSGGFFAHPNSLNRGDTHYWGVWHNKQPFTDYRKLFPRFMSEFGLQSFPLLKTIKSFTLPSDRNIFSSVMEAHQKSGTSNVKILYYISETFKMPKNLDMLLYVSQLVQAEGMRYGVEHWRRNRGRCMGSVYWQLNDCWPGASWSSLDYFGRWKALQYAARRFYEPVHASACEEGTAVSLHVTNESKNAVDGTMSWKLMTADGIVIEEGEKTVTVNEFSSIECVSLDFSDQLDTQEKKRSLYLAYCFRYGDQKSEGTVLFVKPKHFMFADPALKIKAEEQQDRFIINITADSFVKFVGLDLTDADAVFSDNYFDMNAGETKRVEILKEDLSCPLSLAQLKDQLTIRSLYDSYE